MLGNGTGDSRNPPGAAVRPRKIIAPRWEKHRGAECGVFVAGLKSQSAALLRLPFPA